MRAKIFATSLICLTFVAGNATPQTRNDITPPVVPITVIELFTSQGCSSCPPANANLAILARRPDILALSFGVNYWDYLGWRDTFASQVLTDRQRDYARGLGRQNVYTPQMVINGRIDTVGSRLGDLNRTIESEPKLSSRPIITRTDDGVSLGAGTPQARPATVWLVRYDPMIVQVPIQRGENGGKTLPHINIVRELTRLGDYSGQATVLPLRAQRRMDLKSAIVVQSGTGGPILFAAKL